MTNLEWMKCILDLCRLNAEINSQACYADPPMLSEFGRCRVRGRAEAYRNIAGYIEDRIKTLEGLENETVD